MTPTHEGSFRLFKLAGINVYLHWSWFIIAWYDIQERTTLYTSKLWNGLECVTLFAIVLMHEFGHSLACRQMGGKADQIVLWPLGGVAYVSPPQRPGAMLWSIAAGPLVNVILLPVLYVVFQFGKQGSLDVRYFTLTVFVINLGLLVFNLLPIYPLDGGQILRSILWFFIGRARSLLVASIIGFIGVAGLLVYAYLARSWWLMIMAVFVGMNCWRGFTHARSLSLMDKAPRQSGFACPSCHAAPIAAAIWSCGQCQKPLDPFRTQAACPHCGAEFSTARCVDCGAEHLIRDWVRTG